MDPDVTEKVLKGYKADDKTFKVHLDGHNFLPYLTGKEKNGPRVEFFYFSDGGEFHYRPGLAKDAERARRIGYR